jgi:vanillate O-demethylase ferredoxin subunit
MPNSATTMKVRVSAISQETGDISLLELRPVDGELPSFSAGSHIDLHLGNGLIRSYSLTNAASERDRYVIGVKKEPLGRGGSRFIHEQVRIGDETTISGPRNNFILCEEAPSSVLIAGGIGITPLVSMAQRLEELERPWQLHYAARSRCSAGFVSRLAQFGSKVRFYFPTEFQPCAARADIQSIVASASPEAHLYCCGPERMLAAFKTVAAERSPARIHVEHFANAEGVDKVGEFEVVLAKSGRTVSVPSGKSILDTLLELGIDAPYSCMEGVCSSCETRVLSGIPDHRDLILSSEEHAANDRMMICCSRSKSSTLVLEL